MLYNRKESKGDNKAGSKDPPPNVPTIRFVSSTNPGARWSSAGSVTKDHEGNAKLWMFGGQLQQGRVNDLWSLALTYRMYFEEISAYRVSQDREVD